MSTSKITLVEPQKRNKNRVNVYVDGEFCCGMEAFSALKFGIKEGSEIDANKLEASIFDSEADIAFNKSINYLAKCMKTQNQVRQYLLSKGFSQQVVAHVLEKLAGYRYVNDDNYAKMFVEQNCKTKGERRLGQELQSKGISRQLIEKTIGDLECDHAQNAQALAEKYMKNKPNDLKTLQKLQRHLLSRGYSFDTISPIISHFRENSDTDTSNHFDEDF